MIESISPMPPLVSKPIQNKQILNMFTNKSKIFQNCLINKSQPSMNPRKTVSKISIKVTVSSIRKTIPDGIFSNKVIPMQIKDRATKLK